MQYLLSYLLVGTIGLALGSPAAADIRWLVVGVDLDVVVCKNKTNGQKARLDVGVPTSGSCGDLGLTWNEGDNIQVKVVGTIHSPNIASGVVTGITANLLVCKNRSSDPEEKVRIEDPAPEWSWINARLPLAVGERVQWKAKGPADPEADLAEFQSVRVVAAHRLVIDGGDDPERCHGSTRFGESEVFPHVPVNAPSVPKVLIAAARNACDSVWATATRADPPMVVRLYQFNQTLGDFSLNFQTRCSLVDSCSNVCFWDPGADGTWTSRCGGVADDSPDRRILAHAGIRSGDVSCMPTTVLQTSVTVEDVDIGVVCDVGNVFFGIDPP